MTLADTYSKKYRTMGLLIALIALMVSLPACGRVGPPLPPIKNKALVTEVLKVIQRGDALIVSWPRPSVIALQNSRVIRAEILRRNEQASEPMRLSEEQFLEDAQVVGTLTSREISAVEASTLIFTDKLANKALSPELRYRYAIRYVNISGTPLPISNYVLLEPITAIAQPPTDIHSELSQDAIKLSWTTVTTNIDSSNATGLIGYNIYRRTKDSPFADKPLNDTPLTTTSFDDRKFKFSKDYYYMIRSVSQGKSYAIESPNSVEVVVKAEDTFAPASPTNITGAAAANIASLFWPANQERDLKGYLVYRADRRDSPRSEWTKLTPAPISTTTFRDSTGQTNKTYYYFVTAIDEYNNESRPSEAVEVEILQ